MVGREFAQANQKKKKKELNYLKLNFDGSVVSPKSAIGFVIQDDCGSPIVAGATSVGQNTISVAEAFALHEALLW